MDKNEGEEMCRADAEESFKKRKPIEEEKKTGPIKWFPLPKKQKKDPKSCCKCNRATRCTIPDCWRQLLDIKDHAYSLCYKCAKEHFGIDSTVGDYYILNKGEAGDMIKAIADIRNNRQKIGQIRDKHVWDMGCKGSLYLIRRKDGTYCCEV